MTVSTPQGNKTRSPNYPAIDLAEAIKRLKMIYEKQKQYPATREVLAKLLGYSGVNGASATLISALSKYGLIEGYGDNLRVSDLGRDLVLHGRGDPEYTQALRAAAYNPAFFQELRAQYPHGLPSDHSLRASLIKRGFNDKVIGNAVRAYRDTMEFVDVESGEDFTQYPAGSIPEVAMQTQQFEPATSQLAPPAQTGQRAIQLPLAVDQWATLHAPFPLTEAAWTQMLAILNAMKPALVAKPQSPPPRAPGTAPREVLSPNNDDPDSA